MMQLLLFLGEQVSGESGGEGFLTLPFSDAAETIFVGEVLHNWM